MRQTLPLIVLAMAFSGCAHPPPGETLRGAADAYLSSTPEDQRIVSAAWLQRVLAGGRSDAVAVVDIRERGEYEQGRIAGALHVPFKTAARPATIASLPPGRMLILVCKSGHTASMLNALWNVLGLPARTLKDGMRGWAAAAGAVVRSER